jgi:hypothetical protein
VASDVEGFTLDWFHAETPPEVKPLELTRVQGLAILRSPGIEAP